MVEAPQPTFTVSTPTHNRAHTLDRVYHSLRQQTFGDFEWLVIDNESTDGTQQLIERWRAEAPFPIRYVYKHNDGYFASHNLALELAHGYYFIEISSDDACVATALERFKFHWESIPKQQHVEFCGVTVLCTDQHGKLHGQRFPGDVIDSDFTEMRYRYHVRGEKWGCLRTEVARRYPFKRLHNGAYENEGNIWQRVAKVYRTRYVNEALLTFWIHPEQLTKSNPAIYATSNAFWHQTVLNDDIHWFRWSPHEFLRSAVHFSRFSLHAGVGAAAQARTLRNQLARALWSAALPVGWLVYQRDRSRFPDHKVEHLQGQHTNA